MDLLKPYNTEGMITLIQVFVSKTSNNIKCTICCFILLFSFTNHFAFSQQNPKQLYFEHLQVEDGLSSNVTSSILQDKMGFLWFGTDAGLNRYDGYSVKIYSQSKKEEYSLTNDVIKCLFEDSLGMIWIGTDRGLNKYDPYLGQMTKILSQENNAKSLSNNTITAITECNTIWIGSFNGLNKIVGYGVDGVPKFKQYNHDPQNKSSLSNNRIYSLYTDKKGNIWIGTEGGGLNFILNSQDTHTPTSIRRIPYGPEGTLGKIIYSVTENSSGEILVGTELGVNILNLDGDKISIEQFPHPQSNNAPIYSITTDNQNNIWVGTFGDGLNLFDRESGTYKRYIHDPTNSKSLSRNFVYTVYESREHILWIAARETGIDRLDPMLQRFDHIKHLPDIAGSLNNNVVKSMAEGPEGKVWIGTYGGGLNVYDPANGIITNYLHDPNNFNSISNNIIESVCFDNKQRLWIGTANGLNQYDLKTKRFKRFVNNPNNPNSLINNNIWSVCPSKNNKGIWIGTYDGLDWYNFKTDSFTHFKNNPDDPSSLSFNFIRTVYEDNLNNLWVCTWGGGLDKLDLNKNTDLTKPNFQHFKNSFTDTTSISSDLVNTIYKDYDNNIYWVGTQHGLNLFKPENNLFKHFTINEGLSGNVIKSILSDKEGTVWIGTQYGLSKYQPSHNRFYIYSQTDGLQGDIFNLSSCLYHSSGEMYFGGNNGISIFRPSEIVESKNFPRLYLKNLHVNNQKILPNKPFNQRNILNQSLNHQNMIVLNYHENNITFEFSAIQYSSPAKIKFKYKLEGVDLLWSIADNNNRQVTYSNLSPGKYNFKVISTNLNGDWNNIGISKTIIITPPYWASGYAFTVYFILVVLGILLLYQTIKRRQHAKHERLRIEKDQKQRNEIEQYKLQFFTNISHEIRTPLTLIAGPLEKLIEHRDEITHKEQTNSLTIINRNVNILLRLVNQLLDFRKIENKKFTISVKQLNLNNLLKLLSQPFEELITTKNLKLSIQNSLNTNELLVPIDLDKLEKIISNLLSNAIKFTPNDGSISIKLYAPGEKPINLPSVDSSKYICFSVSDTGIGIAKEKQGYIFERFSQIHDSRLFQSGTGIGLSYTKVLVESHKGFIAVESVPNQGSSFYVWLPIDIETYSAEERSEHNGADDQANDQAIMMDAPVLYMNELKQNKESDTSEPQSKPTILIVEDNNDMRSFIIDSLKDKYLTLEAIDGQMGLEIALDKGPDLIISDVMMPIMDGFEFCKQVKQNVKISHTPVILLTAKDTLDDELKGLELRADQYISKPFNTQKLRIIIRNILDERKKLQIKFNDKLSIDPKDLSVTSADERFFEKLTELIEDNISNSDLTVEYIAENVGVSSVHLYRKLKSITGLSASKFVRSFRLKRACQLLMQNKLRIAEVAYTVGFTDPKYFRKCFKEEFGVSPTRYVASQSKEKEDEKEDR